MLSGLQERIARILAELPEARDFALAGGAALIATRLVGERRILTSSLTVRMPSWSCSRCSRNRFDTAV